MCCKRVISESEGEGEGVKLRSVCCLAEPSCASVRVSSLTEIGRHAKRKEQWDTLLKDFGTIKATLSLEYSMLTLPAV